MDVVISNSRYFADGAADAACEYLEALPEAKAALARSERWKRDAGGTWKLRIGPKAWLCVSVVAEE
jgi:hypothetical protein